MSPNGGGGLTPPPYKRKTEVEKFLCHHIVLVEIPAKNVKYFERPLHDR